MATASAILGIISIFGFFLLFFVEKNKFNVTGAKKYSFFRNFPFELNCFRRYSKGSYIFAISLVALGIVFIFPFLGFAIVSTGDFWRTISVYTLFGLVTLAMFSFIALSFIKLSNFKLHTACSTIFIISIFASIILMGLTFTNTIFVYFEIQTVVRYIILFVLLLMFGFVLFLMFNPTKKDWAKLVSYDGENYERPKYSYLCMLEWGGFLTLLSMLIPLYLAMFF